MTKPLSFSIGTAVELNERGLSEHRHLALTTPNVFVITECSADRGLYYGLDNKHWWISHDHLNMLAEPTAESLEQVFAAMDEEDDDDEGPDSRLDNDAVDEDDEEI